VGSKIVGVNGTPCVSKDTIISHIKQSVGGVTQFTIMPASAGRQGSGGGGYAGHSVHPQTLDTFYTSSSSSGGSESDSD
jgi:hypothetical protein